MTMRFRGFALAVAHVVFLFLASTPSAQAAFELTLSEGLNGANKVRLSSDDGCVVLSGTANGCPLAIIDSTNGIVSYAGSIGGLFDLNVTVGLTQPGTQLPTLMELRSIQVNALGAGYFSIEFTDSDIEAQGTLGMNAWGQLSSNAGSSVTYDAFYVGTNETGSGSLGKFGPGTFSDSKILETVPGGTYSMTQKLAYHFTGAGFTVGKYQITTTSVPEPASLAFIGTGLILVYQAFRRKARQRPR